MWPKKGARLSVPRFLRDEVRRIAALRHDNDRGAGITDRLVARRDRIANDLDAYGAEVAFAVAVGSTYDTSAWPGGRTCDCIVGEYSVEVRQTPYRSGHLIAHTDSSSQADVAVLMTGAFPDYEYRGCMMSSDLRSAGRLTPTLGGVTIDRAAYAASQSELRSNPSEFVSQTTLF